MLKVILWSKGLLKAPHEFLSVMCKFVKIWVVKPTNLGSVNSNVFFLPRISQHFTILCRFWYKNKLKMYVFFFLLHVWMWKIWFREPLSSSNFLKFYFESWRLHDIRRNKYCNLLSHLLSLPLRNTQKSNTLMLNLTISTRKIIYLRIWSTYKMRLLIGRQTHQMPFTWSQICYVANFIMNYLMVWIFWCTKNIAPYNTVTCPLHTRENHSHTGMCNHEVAVSVGGHPLLFQELLYAVQPSVPVFCSYCHLLTVCSLASLLTNLAKKKVLWPNYKKVKCYKCTWVGYS